MIDLEMYVTTVANLKKVKDKNVIDKMKMVLNETLRSRYYAVCIDLDGTLVNEKLDSSESLDIISKLLNNNIPIVLTTGRGESSTRQFVEEICQKLEDSKKSRNDLFKLISCICNNGAILMYSSGEREKILDTVTLLPKEKDVEMLTSLGVELNTDLKRKYNEKVTVIPSYSETLDKITNVRFRINDKNIANSLLEDLYKKISDRRPSSENIYKVSMGHYNGDLVYQIGVTDNATSVDLAEYVLGVPKNCMVRICDEGRKYGNDYEILNVSQAFSTGSISDEPFACFPVIDENGNKLIGLAATKYLLDNLDIRPSVCLDKADPDRQKHLLAMAEKNIKQTSNEFKKNKNLIYSSQFGVNDGLYDVYDSDTGGVKFYDYEWDLIDDANPFKELFEKKNSSGQYVNKIESNDATILRGPDSYYYFLSKCVREKEISSEDLKIWRDNTVSELNDFLNALKMAVHDNSINRRFKLAIMDNLRNLSLIMLNVKMVEKFNGTNVHILFDTYKEDTQINKWVEICENVFDGMGKLTTVGNTEELDDKIVETICNIKKIYSNDVNISIDRADSSLNAKAYRNYREIDCYGENRLTLEYAIEKIKEEKPSLNEKDVSFNGMVYGGMELPFIAKEILGKQNNVILGEIMHAGNYTTRHSQTIKDLEKEMFTIYGDSSTLKGHNIVMDDNVLTGKTLQIALNGMFNNDIFVNDVIAVRYPPINRISQMFENNHGAIDTTHFFTYIKGLIIPSPYAKLGYSATKNSLGIQYKDEFNVFDVKKRKICEYIYKTGNYSHGSKVEKELRGERIYG